MLADASFFEKLWNRGIDISAGIVTSTVSAGIIAIIATLTWNFKRKRDLENDEAKQRQQHRISQELKTIESRNDEIVRVSRLKSELFALAERFKSVTDAGSLDVAWRAYFGWLTKNDLQDMPGNQKIIHQWVAWPFASANQQTACGHAERLSKQVIETQLCDEVSAGISAH